MSIPMNIRLFSEEGVEEQEVTETAAEETVTENTTTDEATETETAEVEETVEPKGKTEEDSKFAAVRRKAEEDARKKYEAEQNTINEEFKRVFGSYTNPATGKPIESWKDYLDAIEAQNRKAQEDELRSKGIDPAVFDEYINNSPAIRQANEILKQNQIAEAERQLAADIKTLSEIDPAIKTQDDLFAHPSYAEVLKLVQNNGLSLPDAYKLANYADLSQKHNAAAKQAALNQAKSKSHFERTGGVTDTGKDLAPIPDSVLAKWKRAYPDMSIQQLTEKYNSIL